MAPTASWTCAAGKSPLTGLLGVSNAGHMSGMLKFAGYDHLIIEARAEKPSYLKIRDDEVEIRDAAHLWGKDTYDTIDAL